MICRLRNVRLLVLLCYKRGAQMGYYRGLIRRSWALLSGYPGFLLLGLLFALSANFGIIFLSSGISLLVVALIGMALLVVYARSTAALITSAEHIEREGKPLSF